MSFLYRFFAAVSKLGILYDLKATGTGTDATFSNAQVLDTAAEGVTSGSLIVCDPDAGLIKIVSNEFEITGYAGWDTGLVGGAPVTKALGQALLSTFQSDAGQHLVGFDTDQTLGVTSYAAFPSNTILYYRTAAGSINIGTLVTDNTAYQILNLNGGYDSNGIPWKIGDDAVNFLYGNRLLIKGGAFSAWTLVWLNKFVNTAALYPSVVVQGTNARLFKNILIPTNVLDPGTMFQPCFLDLFTGDNDDQLVSAHTPDIVDGVAGTGNPWESGGTTWTIQSNAANNNPGLEASLLVNGDMELDSNWAGRGLEGGDLQVRDPANGTGSGPDIGGPHGGSYARYISVDAADEGAKSDQMATTIGKIYQVNGWVWPVSGTFQTRDTTTNGFLINSSGTGAWEELSIYDTARYDSINTHIVSVGGGASGYADDFTFREVTLAEIIAVVDMSIVEGTFAAPVTIPTVNDGMGGLTLLYADDNNFVWAYYNRGTGKVELWKRVAGTFTNLINTTSTYAAGADVKAIISDHVAGTSLKIKVYYNNALIGTEQSITDAGIVDNTKHGTMSTSSAITIGPISVMKRTDPAWDAEITAATGGTY